jgi:hypothetical protein
MDRRWGGIRKRRKKGRMNKKRMGERKSKGREIKKEKTNERQMKE